MAEISVNSNEMTLSVSGPMSIFDGASAYGMKVANFFHTFYYLVNGN